jgi:hypothetical protein
MAEKSELLSNLPTEKKKDDDFETGNNDNNDNNDNNSEQEECYDEEEEIASETDENSDVLMHDNDNNKYWYNDDGDGWDENINSVDVDDYNDEGIDEETYRDLLQQIIEAKRISNVKRRQNVFVPKCVCD